MAENHGLFFCIERNIKQGETKVKDRMPAGFLLVLVASIGFGLKSVLVKMIFETGLDALSLIVLRGMIATPMFVGALLLTQGREGLKFSKARFLKITHVTIFGLFATAVLSYFTLAYLPAAVASVIFYSYPVFAFLLMALQGERISSEKVLAFVMTFAGIALLLKIGSADFDLSTIGIILGILTAATFGYYNVKTAGIVSDMSPLKMTTLSVIIINGLLLPLLPFISYPTELETWLLILLLSVFSGFIAFLCFIYGLKKLGAARTVVLNSSSPIFSVGFATFLLGETISELQFAGIGLVLLGIVALKLNSEALKPANLLALLGMGRRLPLSKPIEKSVGKL